MPICEVTIHGSVTPRRKGCSSRRQFESDDLKVAYSARVCSICMLDGPVSIDEAPAIVRHGGNGVIEPRQAPRVARQQHADELRRPRDLLAGQRLPDRIRRRSSRNSDAIFFEPEAAGGDPKRRGSRARDEPQQSTIALEQRPDRRLGAHRARADQQHRSIRDQRRKQIAAAGRREQVAPMICRERYRNRDGLRLGLRGCGISRDGESGDKPPHAGRALRGVAALVEHAAREDGDRRSPLFGPQAEHVERRRAAGHRQIEETGNRGALVGGGDDHQRDQEKSTQGHTYTSNPSRFSPVKAP